MSDGSDRWRPVFDTDAECDACDAQAAKESPDGDQQLCGEHYQGYVLQQSLQKLPADGHDTAVMDAENPDPDTAAFDNPATVETVTLIIEGDGTVFRGLNANAGPVLVRAGEVKRPTWGKFRFHAMMGGVIVEHLDASELDELIEAGYYDPPEFETPGFADTTDPRAW